MRYYSVTDSPSLSLSLSGGSSGFKPEFPQPRNVVRRQPVTARLIILILLSLVSLIRTSHAQWFCIAPPVEELQAPTTCYEPDAKLLHSDTTLLGPIRVALHVIRKSDSTVGWHYTHLTLENLRASCEDAGVAFARDAHILLQFDTTVSYINDDAVYSQFPVSLAELPSIARLSLIHDSPNTLDVFIADNSSISGVLQPTVIPYGACLVSVTQLYDSAGIGAHGRILAHEIGHLLGLYHPHDISHGVEFISRAKLDLYGDSLCFSLGDFCCDTPAEPAFGLVFQEEDCSLDTTGAIRSCSDPDGYRYIDASPEEQPDASNLMGYERPYHCMEDFTPEQARIMRCTYRSWQPQSFVKFVATNRTAYFDNIGGDLIVFPPEPQAGPGAWYVVQSGDTLNLLRGAYVIRVMARDTIRYADILYRCLNWAGDRSQTELVRYWQYDPGVSEDVNNDACTAIFEAVGDSVSVHVTVDGIEGNGIPVWFLDPWKPSWATDSRFFGFPLARHRFVPGWATDTARYRYSPPFRPEIGVFLNQDPDTILNYRNSFYRIASPLAVDGLTGNVFAPGAGHALATGDAFLWRWNSDTATAGFFSNIVEEASLRSGSARFLTDSQTIFCEYKGHLLSPVRLSRNGQRKLVHDGNRHWLLYEGKDSHWLTVTSDPYSGQWAIEREILELPDVGNACLDARDGLVIATAASSQLWRATLLDAATSDPLQTVDIPLDPDDSVACAVIAKQTGAPIIVAVAEHCSMPSGGHALAIAVLRAPAASNDYAFHSLTYLPGARGGIPINPSLACDETGAFHLVWEEQDNVFYSRFLVDASGTIDSALSLFPDQLPICSILMHGSKPSIAVDAFNRPHVVWESSLDGMDNPGSWSQFESTNFGRVIAHRYKTRPYSDPASAKTWSRETIFAIEGQDGMDPVVGCDRFNISKVGISWWTEGDSGRTHVALAEYDASGVQSWKRRTLQDRAATPHFGIRRGGNPLMAYTRTGTHFGSVFQEMEVTADQEHVDFDMYPTILPLEFRGALVRNESFSAAVYFRMYDDSLTGDSVEFIPACDTMRTDLYSQIPGVVRTEALETSRLYFDVHRLVHGISPNVDPGLFDSASVSWWAVIRNAVNDTIVHAVKLGVLARDSVFTCADSVQVRIPFQPVYVEMVVEASIAVFPCVEWGRRVGLSRNEQEYSTQKARSIHRPGYSDIIVLHPAAPNPFAQRTILSFTLREPATIHLAVHDALGRIVAVLLNDQHGTGYHAVEFDGSGLKSGAYYVHLSSGDISLTKPLYILN